MPSGIEAVNLAMEAAAGGRTEVFMAKQKTFEGLCICFYASCARNITEDEDDVNILMLVSLLRLLLLLTRKHSDQ